MQKVIKHQRCLSSTAKGHDDRYPSIKTKDFLLKEEEWDLVQQFSFLMFLIPVTPLPVDGNQTQFPTKSLLPLQLVQCKCRFFFQLFILCSK